MDHEWKEVGVVAEYENEEEALKHIPNLGRREAIVVRKKGEQPNLEELHDAAPWWWVFSEHCLRSAPMALVPFMIRWGPNTSSDMLRRSARCKKCGRKGATLQHPSWAGTDLGFEQFPVGRKVFSAGRRSCKFDPSS